MKETTKLFQSDCTVLHSHHQNMLVPAHPHPFQHLILISLILAILIDVWWYFIVFFICISLRLLMLSTFPCACLPSVYYYFFFGEVCWNNLFELFSYYCILRALCILDVGLMSDTCFAHLCSQSIFILLIVFWGTEVVGFDEI